jgi:thioredoxin 1
MKPAANAIRFFESFDFPTPAELGQSACKAMSLRMLRFCRTVAQPVRKSLVMFNEPEKTNTQNGAPIDIAAKNFKTEVLESTQPVLVEFWAPWSRPCQVLDSVLRELASVCAGKVKVAKVNADDSLDLSLWYEIQSVPTLLYFVQGKPRVRIVGTATKEAILAKLEPFSQ